MNRSRAGVTALLVLSFGSIGCISKPPSGAQLFSIDPPRMVATHVAPGAHIVSVDRVEVAPEFAGRSLSYRTGPHSFEKDPYAILAAPPRDLVLAVLRASLTNTDFVRDVVEQGGPVAADLLVEAYVTDLEGDFTVPGKPVAVVGVEMVVLWLPPVPQPVSPLLRKAYLRRLPLSEKTATAVANGWNEGLTAIVQEFLEDTRAVLPAAPAPSH
ncbi:MAG: ABC-type transport auxiliary lipoprotein family protein [Myxococcaceae bacterium]